MSLSRCYRGLHLHGRRSRPTQTCIEMSLPFRPSTQPHRGFADSQTSPSSNKDKASERPKEAEPSSKPAIEQGSLDNSSIFHQAQPSSHKPSTHLPFDAGERNPTSMAPALDPNPQARERFEQKMILRELRRRGRLTREEALKRTERQFVGRSSFHQTSTKKLAPLARQIAGKTLQEAIIQMEFSKKRSAMWIREYLLKAENQAIIQRGMGLGHATVADGPEQPIGKSGRWVQLKDGSRHLIRDSTAIYVDQAWVNKGSHGTKIKKRARGKLESQKRRTASISVLLKEEATRIRQHEERIVKEEKKKVWVQLPNRAISSHRPYYSW